MAMQPIIILNYLNQNGSLAGDGCLEATEEQSGGAHVPWLSTSTKSCPLLRNLKTDLKKGAHWKKIKESNVKLFAAFNRAFPFYLPSRYHKLDSIEMHKFSDRGTYWETAGLFLSLIIDRGTMPYYNLHKGAAPGKFTIKEAREVCETAEEFLFEPWVLIQLPFQPALLHQWAVAAYAESLIFSRRLVEIGTKGYAQEVHDLCAKLAELGQTLSHNCSVLFAYFFQIYCEQPSQNVLLKAKTICSDFPSKFLTILPQTLTFLKFIMSDECDSIFKFIQKTSWTKEHSPLDLTISANFGATEECGRTEFLVNIYNELFWIKKDPTCLFNSFADMLNSDYTINGDVQNIFDKNTNLYHEVVKTIRDAHNSGELRNMPCIDFKAMDHETIQGIRGAVHHPATLKNMEEFYDHLESRINTDEFKTLKLQYSNYISLKKENASSNHRLPDLVGGGVLQQLFNLQAEVTRESAQGKVTNMVWCAAKNFDPDFHLNSENISVPSSFSVQALEDKLDGLAAGDDQWTLKNLLWMAEDLIDSQGPAETQVESTVLAFKKRIQTLVLEMYKANYAEIQDSTATTKFSFSPECPIVHYILPCFVAACLDVAKDPDISQEGKNDYYGFVHELIFSYESRPYVQQIEITRLKYPYNFSDWNDWTDNATHFLQIFKRLFKGSKTLQKIMRKFVSSWKISAKEFIPLHHPEPELFSPTDLKIQLRLLFCRINYCFEKLGWSSRSAEPNPLLQFSAALELFRGFSTNESDVLKLKLVHGSHAADCEFKKALVKLGKVNRIQKSVLKDLENLSVRQLLNISVHQTYNPSFSRFDCMQRFYQTNQSPLFSLDPFHCIIGNLMKNELLDTKEFLDSTKALDKGLITLQTATKNACLWPLLQSLQGNRVKMEQPGQVTFFPVQHCGWCGLVDASAFRLCVECQDEPHYPLPNYFCSEKCEKNSLDDHHLEEHAQFTAHQLGIF